MSKQNNKVYQKGKGNQFSYVFNFFDIDEINNAQIV